VRAQQHELSAAAAAWREEKEVGESKCQKLQREKEGLENVVIEERRRREEAEGGGGGGRGGGGGGREEMEGRLRMVSGWEGRGGGREGGRARKEETQCAQMRVGRRKILYSVFPPSLPPYLPSSPKN